MFGFLRTVRKLVRRGPGEFIKLRRDPQKEVERRSRRGFLVGGKISERRKE